MQVSGLRGDLERVQQDKADTTSLEAYTARVSALFEQVHLCRGCGCAAGVAVQLVWLQLCGCNGFGCAAGVAVMLAVFVTTGVAEQLVCCK
eukprot:593567-Pelagomonas_calceolata.AAC.3